MSSYCHASAGPIPRRLNSLPTGLWRDGTRRSTSLTANGKHYAGSAPADPFERPIKRRVSTIVSGRVLGAHPDLGTVVLADGDLPCIEITTAPEPGPWANLE